MQDESASVQVYVLNPCLVPIPRQMDQYLILTAACDHLLVAGDGTLVNSRAAQPFVAKSFQVQVPAGLNLQHRSVADFASKGCTTLKLRPREAGVARLKVPRSSCRTLRHPAIAQLNSRSESHCQNDSLHMVASVQMRSHDLVTDHNITHVHASWPRSCLLPPLPVGIVAQHTAWQECSCLVAYY